MAKISISLTEKHFTSVFNIINVVEEMLESYLYGLSIAMMVSGILCLICFFCSSFSMLLDFRKRVFELRRGFYDYDIKQCNVVNSVFQYLGFHISNEILSFIILFLVFSLGLSFIFWKYFWILLWDNKDAIFAVIGAFIIVKIGIIIVTG